MIQSCRLYLRIEWVGRESLQEENRVLREPLDERRVLFTDGQRRRERSLTSRFSVVER